MSSTIIIAILTFVSSIFGSLLSAISMTKLVNYRLELLEKKMDSVETLLERMTVAELKIKEIDNYVKDNCE